MRNFSIEDALLESGCEPPADCSEANFHEIPETPSSVLLDTKTTHSRPGHGITCERRTRTVSDGGYESRFYADVRGNCGPSGWMQGGSVWSFRVTADRHDGAIPW